MSSRSPAASTAAASSTSTGLPAGSSESGPSSSAIELNCETIAHPLDLTVSVAMPVSCDRLMFLGRRFGVGLGRYRCRRRRGE